MTGLLLLLFVNICVSFVLLSVHLYRHHKLCCCAGVLSAEYVFMCVCTSIWYKTGTRYLQIPLIVNTFTAIVDLSRFHNSCLKLPASTLVDLIIQSCSFSLNQLTCHYRQETCTAASVYLADIICIAFIVYCAYIVK
jgi:hypothetical protein